jgi:predicted transglutaminase-like cysteine proteinase
MKFWSLAIVAAISAYGVSPGANARSITDQTSATFEQARMPVQGAAEAPIGHVRFCYRYPGECDDVGHGDSEVFLTTVRWAELSSVNSRVNEMIKPVSDDIQYGTIEHWTYPSSGEGDCEDYVLLKVRKLVAMGWPPAALLITVVRDENDEGHAVLTVRTHRGDLVLDNKHSRILAWHNTPYTYIKRQSAFNKRNWESLIPLRDTPAVAASGADTRK